MGAGLFHYECKDEGVTKKLDEVFRYPGTQKYIHAHDNNTFNTVRDVQGNWNDLVTAYDKAGVDVGGERRAWLSYLAALGAGAQGQADIVRIAKARNDGLTKNWVMITTRHEGGDNVVVTEDDKNHIITIDSRCPL
jgi:hypothetical protein